MGRLRAAWRQQSRGLGLTSDWLNELGRRVIDLARSFSRATDFTSADDRLPVFFREEPLAPTGSVFDVSDEALDAIWE